MTPNESMKLLLKLTVLLIFVFSTSSTNQCTPKKTERDGYAVRNIGIKLCQLKCTEHGQCVSIEYNVETLTCRLSSVESKNITKKEAHVILARDTSHVPTSSCSSSMCSFGQRCLETRSGNTVCAQDEKLNYVKESPQHKVDKQETFVNSPIHEACRKGDLSRVSLILSKSLAYVNIRDDKYGRTPLMVAAQEGHCRIFEFLIRKGANMSEVDNDCKNALHWACKGGHVGMVECVLRQYKININAKQMRPLMQAAWKGYKDVVEFLVCTGSNLSQVNDDGNDALHLACKGGHLDVVNYLLSQSNVDINRQGNQGKTPLMLAVINRHKYVFEFLMQNGANVSQVDIYGNNILYWACRSGHLDVVKYLLSQSNVDINRRGNTGRTPVMVAVFYRRRDVFEFLVQKGANVAQVDYTGESIMRLACRRRQLSVVRYLLSQSSVDINSRGKKWKDLKGGCIKRKLSRREYGS